MFLPDRYIKGTARTAAPDQYGDTCENCGATYAPTDLKNPLGAHRAPTPVLREVRALLLQALGPDAACEFLRGWTGRTAGCSRRSPTSCANGSTAGRSSDWDISRDAPYFGFQIPDAPGKYFYVWLDAPIGYLAASSYCATATGAGLRRCTCADSDGRACIHFIGKDIIYFHGLFWPAMLHGAGSARRTRARPRLPAPSTARRCPSRAAPSSARSATSTPA